ncbi:hypothetical protein A3Q56_06512 [Intoshia linei]|uniref:HAT C-terminal dimerisation domain-containing protein n=1 Tax=Intoshia linei TaxID=1819745 RepID=A0A177AUV0_9BILA|nr:hypothetical protein A3Q56_06512 [Intoshia linei]
MEKKLDSKTTIIQLIENCNSNLFPYIYQLLIILATLPITTCERERSISILRRLKTFLKYTMTGNRLCGLDLMNWHYDYNFYIESLVNEFEILHPRILNLIDLELFNK